MQGRTSDTLKKEAICKIIQDIGETLNLHSLRESVNPFIDEWGKIRHMIVKMLDTYHSVNSSTKYKALITLSMIKSIIKKATLA